MQHSLVRAIGEPGSLTRLHSAPPATPPSISLDLSRLGLPPTAGHPRSLPPRPRGGIAPKSVPFCPILPHFVAGSLGGRGCLERLARPDSGTGDTKCSGNVTGRRGSPTRTFTPIPVSSTGQALTFPHQGEVTCGWRGQSFADGENSTGVRGVQGGWQVEAVSGWLGRRRTRAPAPPGFRLVGRNDGIGGTDGLPLGSSSGAGI